MNASFQYDLFLILTPLAAIMLLAMIAFAWRYRHASVGETSSLLWLNLVLLGWLLFNSLELLSPLPDRTLFWAQLSYFFISLASPAWMIFALNYGQQTHWLRLHRFGWLLIIPAVTILLIWTNSWHRLVWREIAFLAIDGLLAMQIQEYGWWFWVNVGHSYILVLAGALIILYRYFRGSSLFRRQSVTVVIGALTPIATNVVYLFGLIPGLTKDYTAISFALASVAIWIGIYRFHLFNLRPVARDAVVDSLGDPMLVLDSQDRIVDINPAGRQLLQLLGEQPLSADLIGRPLIHFLDSWQTLAAPYRGVTELQTDLTIAVNGRDRHYDLRISPLQVLAQELSGRLVVLREITEQVQAQQALQDYAAQLELRNRELDAYAHTVAHDLKAPLVGTLGLSEYLLECLGELTLEQQKALLQDIIGSSRKMANIVDSLLLLASVRRQEDVALTLLDMDIIVAEVQRRLTRQIEAAQAEILLPDCWQSALGYGPWIEEVWVNYITNGLKYGGNPAQGIPPRLRLGSERLSEKKDGQHFVRFWVEDNGPGISASQQTALFAEFSRIDQKRNEGHGLGLSIVRRIVERLGGQAGVNSQPGQGSTFWFTLPGLSEKSTRAGRRGELRVMARSWIDGCPHLGAKSWIHLGALLAYALLTGIMTWPLAAEMATAIPGDSFDGWQNYWNLWWIKVALLERGNHPFVTDLLYHPTGVGLYFHTLNPFNGLFTLPVQLSLGLIPAYNTVVWVSWILGGYGTMLLARYVLGRGQPCASLSAGVATASFLAGVIRIFAPVHMAHLLGHMQVMSLEWMPFTILALMQARDRQRRGQPWLGKGLLAGLFLVGVGLCDWYFVLYLFLFTGLYLTWQAGKILFQAWRGRTLNLTALLGALFSLLAPPLTAGGLFLILLGPILWPMVREAVQFSFMVRPASDLYILSASVADFLIPNRLHTLFRPQSFTWPGNQIAPVSERTLSIGYTALCLALFSCWRASGRSLFWLVSAAFFGLLALGPALHWGNITMVQIPQGSPEPSWTLYGLLNRAVPFMRISRSVSRFAIMVELSVAVAAALGIDALWRAIRAPTYPGRGRALAGLLLLLILAESWVAPYPLSPPDTPVFYTQLGQHPQPGAVLNLPMNYDRPGYLLYQTVHRRPLTVAYISRDDPRTLTERMPVLQHLRHLGPDILAVDLAQIGLTVLRDLDVAFVVLDRYKMPGGEERSYTTQLAGTIFAGQPPLYEDDRLTVYAVPQSGPDHAYLSLGALNLGAPARATRRGRTADFDQPGPGPSAPCLGIFAHLRLRYQSVEGVGVIVESLDGQPLAELPPAPQGAGVLIAIPQHVGVTPAMVELAATATIRLRVTAWDPSSSLGDGAVHVLEMALLPE